MTIKNRIRNSLAALAVGATALAAFAGPASAATPTKVLIQAESGGFHGSLKSSKAKCRSERTVILFEQLGSRQSPATDQRVGSDTTSYNGEWDMGNPGLHEGLFYARVTLSAGCKAANSITLEAQE